MNKDALVQVVKDIIDLKYNSNNIADDDILENMLDHYTAVLLHGNVELLYRYGELMGFMEWIRLPHIPKDNRFTYKDIDTEHGGSVLYIMNSCVKDDIRHKTLWNLVHRVKVKNPHFDVVCWHNRQGGLYIYNNIKNNVKTEVMK